MTDIPSLRVSAFIPALANDNFYALCLRFMVFHLNSFSIVTFSFFSNFEDLPFLGLDLCPCAFLFGFVGS